MFLRTLLMVALDGNSKLSQDSQVPLQFLLSKLYSTVLNIDATKSSAYIFYFFLSALACNYT